MNTMNFEERLDRMGALLDQLVEHQVHMDEKLEAWTERQLQAEERHDKEMAEIRAELRRAVRLSIEEQRRERVRRQELTKKLSELAVAQALTEQELKAFIESLRKPTNGNH
jgi:hypothetical protein